MECVSEGGEVVLVIWILELMMWRVGLDVGVVAGGVVLKFEDVWGGGKE